MSLLHAAAVGKTAGKVQWVLTPALMLKCGAAIIFGGLALYYLNTGKKQQSLERLIWAGVFGLLSALVFAL